jgi:DNA-binding CsgD family transcriptional regulator
MTPIGEVIRANEAGYELLEGKSFCVKNGLISINQATVMQQFRDKLAEIRILGRDSLHNFVWNRGFHSTADKHNYQLMLKVHELHSWQLESSNYDRFVTLMVATPDITASPTSEQLRDFFDLSNAQARVVLALLEGNDVMTSAAKLHISINTMRSHMRAIYAKMGVNNQSDLLRLLAGTLVDY